VTEGVATATPTLKRRVYEILEVGDPNDRASRVFGYFLIAVISINTIALVLGTVQSIYNSAPLFFNLFETITVGIFLVEYALRLWASTADSEYALPVTGRLRWTVTPLALIDLTAILPSFIALLARLLFGVDVLNLSFLRAVRLAVRVARLSRYSSGVRALGRVVYQKREDLLTVVAVLLVLLLMASSLMYFAERDAQPDAFSSIPAAMWWSIITLTTVGYGDVFPITAIGRAIAGVIAILGIGMFALPAGILGSGFLEELQQRRGVRTRVCPHCGEEFQD
jgi:voltage-gated potassium channel